MLTIEIGESSKPKSLDMWTLWRWIELGQGQCQGHAISVWICPEIYANGNRECGNASIVIVSVIIGFCGGTEVASQRKGGRRDIIAKHCKRISCVLRMLQAHCVLWIQVTFHLEFSLSWVIIMKCIVVIMFCEGIFAPKWKYAFQYATGFHFVSFSFPPVANFTFTNCNNATTRPLRWHDCCFGLNGWIFKYNFAKSTRSR